MCLPSKTCGMVRKITMSISLEPEQVEWLDAQEHNNSKLLRQMIDERREVEA